MNKMEVTENLDVTAEYSLCLFTNQQDILDIESGPVCSKAFDYKKCHGDYTKCIEYNKLWASQTSKKSWREDN